MGVEEEEEEELHVAARQGGCVWHPPARKGRPSEREKKMAMVFFHSQQAAPSRCPQRTVVGVDNFFDFFILEGEGDKPCVGVHCSVFFFDPNSGVNFVLCRWTTTCIRSR